MEQKELRRIIEKGVEKLEEIADVKWPTAHNSKISKEKLILAIEQSHIKNIAVYKLLGYKLQEYMTQAMIKIATNIPNRPNSIYWKFYILRLAGYKRCPKCETIKLLEEFSNCDDKSDGKQIYCRACQGQYKKDNSSHIKNRNKEYYSSNKEGILKEQLNSKKEKVLHIINVMIREGRIKEAECSICSYKKNWAALEFHHIDSKLERPEWAYNKKGKKITPGVYLFSNNKEESEKRYLIEMNNLELLCANCHRGLHHKKWVLPLILIK